MCAAISAPKPQNCTASWTTTTRFVFATDAAIVSVSSGTSVRGSITSTLDALALELARGAQRVRDHRAERDDRDVGSLAARRAPAELDRVALLRHRHRLAEEEQLLLEEDHGVVVLDRRREQALRVERVRRHHDDEARDVREQRLQALRVLRAEAHAAAGDHPEHERHASACRPS